MHFIISKHSPKDKNIPTINKTLKGIIQAEKVPGETE
jgi:hypothetical protein